MIGTSAQFTCHGYSTHVLGVLYLMPAYQVLQAIRS